MLLAYKAKSRGMSTGRAAEEIARSTARELLAPLLDTVCTRLGFLLRHTFDIAAERLQSVSGAVPSHLH